MQAGDNLPTGGEQERCTGLIPPPGGKIKRPAPLGTNQKRKVDLEFVFCLATAGVFFNR